MAYDNSAYWKGLHERLSGSLKAVGHPDLSETANLLKYESETKSLTESLSALLPALSTRDAIEVLDVGAGTGYWTRVVAETLGRAGLSASMTALDISEDALSGIRESLPGVKTVRQDLKTVDQDLFSGRFRLVNASYCLHHLTRASDFLNALSFCAGSVAPGGFFILMDPVLTMPYSPFSVLEFSTYRGNGVVRPLHFIEDGKTMGKKPLFDGIDVDKLIRHDDLRAARLAKGARK